MKKILVVVDMQNDFLTGALGSADCAATYDPVRQKIAVAKKAGVEVVFTRDTHQENYLTTQEGKRLPVVHCVKDTFGWQIAEGLYNGEKVFDKPTFGSLELAEYLRSGEYGEIEFVGVCTDICVVSNAVMAKAYCPNATVKVDSACCAGTSKQNHESAIATMKCCQVEVR